MKEILILLLIVLGTCKFPKKFEFGVSTAAFQIEGAWLADNKSLSIWDNLAHSGLVVANSTDPDIGDDSYNKYLEDIALMKDYGIKNYRMSIAWTRIVPNGTNGSRVNQKGIDHYKKLFRDLTRAGITPYVTLYHNDMPAYLYIQGTGYTDPDFIEDFKYYADVCFKEFGDLVKYWFTFNEPWVLAVLDEYTPEEVMTKPYDIGHALLLAHAHTVKLYREKYQNQQKGKIGWVFNAEMYFPKDVNKKEDVEAAERALMFQLDWFCEPMFSGDYPQKMKEIINADGKGRMKSFTEAEKNLLKGSMDFYALNHYFTWLAEPARKTGAGFDYDRNVNLTFDSNWNQTDMEWSIVPEGLHRLIMYIHGKWLNNTNMELFITENGAAIKNESDINSIKIDKARIEYLHGYLGAVEEAIIKGVNITKYFVWSLLDNFEWGSGFSKKFGIVRVELDKNAKRIAKGSMKWYSELIKDLL